MKVKCDKCGEIKEMQYLGNGMYQVSEEMKEHEKEHKGTYSYSISSFRNNSSPMGRWGN